MFKALILPAAKEDLLEAAMSYDQQQPGLGKRFTVQIRKKLNSICRNPQAYLQLNTQMHTVVLGIFPYLIHFQINETKRTILVAAILETKETPEE